MATNIFINIIKEQTIKELSKNIWKNSPYKDLIKLQKNNIGIVGEKFINDLCKSLNILSNCNGVKTKNLCFDGYILNKPIEIKTAHQGCSSGTFQHELGETPWINAKYMLFLDISPKCLYLTIFKNFDESTYKSKEKLNCFPTKSITWRKKSGAFKLDTSVKINEKNIILGNTIKITRESLNEDIKNFILKKIE